ncbi:amidohydrolase family protein, partial [Corynebacterium stationis]|uniref:amidohydrolase family protein n=3 Tax=Corynebacterium TaxID=1716 RepID=UPI0017510A0C
MTQTTVYTGKIWTGVADDDWVEAFAVADGRIIATGALHEVEDQVGTPHETIIIDKGIVTPGLIDGHLHLSLGGTQLAHELALDPTDDAETILAKVREWTSRLKPGEWVIGG